jgi:fatty-acid desaturase
VVGVDAFYVSPRAVSLWGVFLFLTLALHATWLVISAMHPWGEQDSKRVTIRAIVGGWRC